MILGKEAHGGTRRQERRGRRAADGAGLRATGEAAARASGLGERTVRRRLADPDFMKRLKDIRSDMVRRAAGSLTAATQQSVQTLLVLQKEGTPPAVRLGAARAVIELGARLREMAEFEERFEALVLQVEDLKEQEKEWQRRQRSWGMSPGWATDDPPSPSPSAIDVPGAQGR